MTTASLTVDPKDIRGLFNMLLGRDVTVSPDEGSFKSEAGDFQAVYETDEGIARAFCVCDFRLATYAGAALSMIPARVAEESVPSRSLDEGITENFREVMNVCVGPIQSGTGTHLSLGSMEQIGSELPDGTVPDLHASACGSVDFVVQIAGYGEGRCSFGWID